MLLTLVLAASTAQSAAPVARFDAVQMMKLDRLADPQLSPDGKWVAYQSTDVDLDAGTRNTDIWVVAADGQGVPRRLTSNAAADTRPRWSPDGTRIAFDSARGGAAQVWIVPAGGGDATKVTSLATEASGALWIDA